MTLEEEHKQAAAQLADVQVQCGKLEKGSPGREALKAEMDRLLARMKELKESIKTENTRRNFAGIGNNPFFIACSERFDAATIGELSERAIAIQIEREQSAAARRAAKQAATPEPSHAPEPARPPEPPKPTEPHRPKPDPKPPRFMSAEQIAAVKVERARRPNGARP